MPLWPLPATPSLSRSHHRPRYGQGLASLVELEDARRNALAAESAQLSLGLERNRAWVSLYRALGGGFEPDRLNADVTSSAADQSRP